MGGMHMGELASDHEGLGRTTAVLMGQRLRPYMPVIINGMFWKLLAR